MEVLGDKSTWEGVARVQEGLHWVADVSEAADFLVTLLGRQLSAPSLSVLGLSLG